MNSFALPVLLVVVAGVTVIEVSASLTVTVTSLLVFRDPSEVVACRLYVQLAPNVAIACFAAFVLLSENVMGAGGVPTADQVYFSSDSPPSSAPTTLRFTVVPLTGFRKAVASEASVGAPLIFISPTIRRVVTPKAEWIREALES